MNKILQKIYHEILEALLFETQESAQKILDENLIGHTITVNDDGSAIVTDQKGQRVITITC